MRHCDLGKNCHQQYLSQKYIISVTRRKGETFHFSFGLPQFILERQTTGKREALVAQSLSCCVYLCLVVFAEPVRVVRGFRPNPPPLIQPTLPKQGVFSPHSVHVYLLNSQRQVRKSVQTKPDSRWL